MNGVTDIQIEYTIRSHTAKSEPIDRRLKTYVLVATNVHISCHNCVVLFEYIRTPHTLGLELCNVSCNS